MKPGYDYSHRHTKNQDLQRDKIRMGRLQRGNFRSRIQRMKWNANRLYQ